jgi:hypothetical protein|tara:strand:+ start:35493 stop:36278 length:786 start_codon:yes stop_codon:yes gene_type:complete
MFIKNIVIGSTIESIFYAFKNGYYFVSTRRAPPMFYQKIDVSLLGHEYLPGAWNRLNFMMGLLGLRSSFSNFDTFKVEENKIKIVESGLVYTYEFERCFIFDPTGVNHENKTLEARPSTYLVLDDFEVSRLGGKRTFIPNLKEDRDFAREAHFYISDRIDGSTFISDCVVESKLTKQQLYDFDYSDTMVKFILQRYLTSIGVHGIFVEFYKNGNSKYRKPKIKHVNRLVFERDTSLYEDSRNIKFLNMNLKDIVNDASAQR